MLESCSSIIFCFLRCTYLSAFRYRVENRNLFSFSQKELETLTATQKQLENQKGEAQKRLNDLKAQVGSSRESGSPASSSAC